MSATFAGSRNLDDRRRRRLAQETQATESAVTNRQRSAVVEGGITPSTGLRAQRKYIPESAEAVVWYCLSGLLLWAGVLHLGLSPWPARYGLEEYFSLQTGQTVNFFNTVMMLLCAQLSFVILSCRSLSRTDFGGRYRFWVWSGCFWSVVCFATSTGIYIPLSARAFEAWPVNCWRPEVMYWLVPFAVCYVTIHRLSMLEMRNSATARRLWSCALLLGTLTAIGYLGADIVIVEDLRQPLLVAMSTLWRYLLVMALVAHARHVVHISNEPAKTANSLRGRLAMWLWSQFRELRERLRADDAGEEVDSDDSGQGDASTAAKKTKPKRTTKPKSPKVPPQRVLNKTIRVDEAETKAAPHAVAKEAKPAVKSTGRVSKAATPHTEPSAGSETLSKKSRKRKKK